ncbi:Coq4 family protein [Mycobacterium sp. CVI_P3]|uniref:Coq4 family protein n=1 Tax=Mycobacterium pinniadriaticum TaxID=2994102 RepID=A0ABT3SD09_9MYCO|nr:Coq4 family protein [Mycobacterium pinniadriaticum]MCX2930964.1 Coq4 family protein [Mycobacterium pinniadriaticum]MCX2937388.1 Coq4 family protein [Mycobacterium pinniadriaticum]
MDIPRKMERYGQLRVGLRALTRIFGVKFNHDQVFETVIAFGFPTLEREFDKLTRLPQGRRLLRDKPDLMALLGDDDYLAALPPGSLGAAYRDFLRQHRLDAGVFDAASVIQPVIDRNGWDPDFGYMIACGTVLHDMFHVLGGPDPGGEIGNLGFHHGQLGQCRTTAVFGLILCAIIGGGSWRRKRRYWHEAVDRGRAADNLMAAPYEELLPLPLTEVRATLGIPPTDIAHPTGHFFTRWQLPASGIAPYEPWNYEASLVESAAT